MKLYTVYKIHNIETNMDYIGWSGDPINRIFNQHERTDSYIGNALRVYGWDTFDVSILHLVKTKKEACKLEIKEIAKYNSVAPNGYNLTPGGDNPPNQTGHYHTEKQKAKWRSGERKGDKNNSRLPGVGVKISKTKQGKKRPDIAEKNKGNKYGQGRIYKPSKKSGIKRSITCLKKAIIKLEQELDK